MPFKSEKQRRWMNANKPKMAKRWEKYAEGGPVDNVPAMLTEGEYVIKRDAVNGSTLDMLEYINKHGDLPMSDAKNRRRK